MLVKYPFRLLLLSVVLVVFGVTSSFAQGSCTNCTTVSSNLTLSATAETAIQLNIATGTSGATVSGSAGAFTVSFGVVNGLGLGTPATGVTAAVSGSGATYTTPIFVTPTFSGFSGTTATVKVYQDSTTSAASQASAVEGTAPGSVSAVPTTIGAANTVSSSAASGTSITRYVGLFISNSNGGSAVTGALAPKIIYVVTVP